jgi:hypothetical protein
LDCNNILPNFLALYENDEVREECADPVTRPLKANIITVFRDSTATAVAQLMPDELAVEKKYHLCTI